MSNWTEGIIWKKQLAETDLVWASGSVYPIAIICTVYEISELGEKRFIERKTLKLVEED